MKKYKLLVVFALLSFSKLYSQIGNFDETKVTQFEVPNLLLSIDSASISTSSEWMANRADLISLFEEHIYGRVPDKKYSISFEVLANDKNALEGKATRREVAIRIETEKIHTITMLMYIPNDREGKVPLFVGLNFKGNHSVSFDPQILKSVIREQPPREGVLESEVTDYKRGDESSRWPIERIIANGYAVATIYRGDIDPDYDDGFQNGIHPLFYAEGQTKPKYNEWGTVAAWAWGLSRAMDYFVSDADIDESKVAVIGHSRLGKAALWAGVTDTRFAMVISNNSGCAGASLSRRRFGETIYEINTRFPHWFCSNFKQYNDKEYLLPIDQHQLIALLAPRPVYIASASEDGWADPKGEFLSSIYASPVYGLFGLKGLTIKDMPSVNEPAMCGYIGYHLRQGKHDITDYDWQQYLLFANKKLK